jgi:hypothetical protein
MSNSVVNAGSISLSFVYDRWPIESSSTYFFWCFDPAIIALSISLAKQTFAD